jgi:hypothetical protein
VDITLRGQKVLILLSLLSVFLNPSRRLEMNKAKRKTTKDKIIELWLNNTPVWDIAMQCSKTIIEVNTILKETEEIWNKEK